MRSKRSKLVECKVVQIIAIQLVIFQIPVQIRNVMIQYIYLIFFMFSFPFMDISLFLLYNYPYWAYGGDWPCNLILLPLYNLEFFLDLFYQWLSTFPLISINSYSYYFTFPIFHPLFIQLGLYWFHCDAACRQHTLNYHLMLSFSTLSFYATIHHRSYVYPCKP